jgi:hypothetical protein
VDWGSVVSTVVTGVVGLAGIGGSIMSARLASKSATENLRRSITAEDIRAKRAEKRLVYAKCLAALAQYKEFYDAPYSTDFMASTGPAEMRDLRAAASIAIQEAELVGSPELAQTAYQAFLSIPARDRDWEGLHTRLVEAMRTDLNLTEFKQIEPSTSSL